MKKFYYRAKDVFFCEPILFSLLFVFFVIELMMQEWTMALVMFFYTVYEIRIVLLKRVIDIQAAVMATLGAIVIEGLGNE